jgi:Flp pilus assembly protein TadG
MRPSIQRTASRRAWRPQSARKRGQSLVETLAGFMIIIPLALFAIDITTVVVANQTNERLAEEAARSAANQLTLMLGQQSAQAAIDHFQCSQFITAVSMQNFAYDEAGGHVSVTTQMDVKLPVSWATLGKVSLCAQATQPIVASPAPM